MAITSTDIENQSFSIDRKGYDVDEVDVFLERVSTEVDNMNKAIADLQSRLEAANARAEAAEKRAEAAAADIPVSSGSYTSSEATPYELREKDRRIAELEKQLDERNADANAIAQALIIAQRSGDEIIANAKKAALATQKDAEDEAKRILDKANGEKQRVMSNIAELQTDRESVRAGYQDMLRTFITDASKKLTEIGGDMPAHVPTSFPSAPPAPAAPVDAAAAPVVPVAHPAVPDPLESFTATYTTPRSGAHGVTPIIPKASAAHKDLSGFGETDDAFGFDDLD